MSAQQTDQEFSHNGKAYQLRLISDGWIFTVRAFSGGRPANGYTHSVSLPTAFDLNQTKGCQAIEALFEAAKADIRKGTWEHFLKNLNSLNLTEDQSVGCQKCTSRNIEVKQIDNRKMYLCKSCDNLWYENRTLTGATEMILDDITEGVINHGSQETLSVVLLNTTFCQGSGKPNFWDQLKNWCTQNYLSYEPFYKQVEGENKQWIRFTRRVLR
jgi:hypothetical protein